MRDPEKLRLKIAFLVFAAAFLAVVGKAFKIQVIDKEQLIAKSNDQFFRENKVFPKRGNIYDREGHSLAINVQTYSIFAIPKNIESRDKTLKKLANIVPSFSYSKMRDDIGKRTRFTWLGRKMMLKKKQVKKIKELPGIYIEGVPKRMYPNNELLAQTLGFVGIDNVGLAGIEYLFDDKLKGKPKILRYIIDNKGRPVKFESANMEGDSQDIHLTIDKDLQFISEKYLREAVEKHDASMGGIGIMDAKTGEILAVANYPNFDPNDPGGLSGSKYHRLPFVSDPFEPGSTFKTFTVASALEHEVAKPNTNYYCERGKLKIGEHLITEAESKKKFEWMSVEEILQDSSNIGTTKIAFDLTFPRLKKTLKDFGFGEKTGIQIPGESRGIFTEEENVRPIRLSNVSFGQGVAATGIQMLRAYAAIANGGKLVEPRILQKANAEERAEPKRIISEETSKTLTDILVKAVEDGTGGNAQIPYFTIAGKTSTAQKAGPSGGYDGYIPGFVGYPVNVKDKFVIYVYIDDPKTKIYYGNAVAAPVFKKVAQYLLYKSKDFDKLKRKKEELASSDGIDLVKMKQSSTRYRGQGVAPDFLGLDKISSKKMGNRYDLKLNHRGIGVVSSQKPSPGTPLAEDEVVKLRYRPPEHE